MLKKSSYTYTKEYEKGFDHGYIWGFVGGSIVSFLSILLCYLGLQ